MSKYYDIKTITKDMKCNFVITQRNTRLQGKKWEELKDKLIPIKYEINKNNHIKGYYRDDGFKRYTHWLNDKEINEIFETEKLEKYIMNTIKEVKNNEKENEEAR